MNPKHGLLQEALSHISLGSSLAHASNVIDFHKQLDVLLAKELLQCFCRLHRNKPQKASLSQATLTKVAT